MLYCSKTEIPNGWVLTGVKGGVEQQRPILRRSVQDGEGARGFDAQIGASNEEGATTTGLSQQLVRCRGPSMGGSQRLSAAVRSANLGGGGARRCGSGDTGLPPLSRHEGWQRRLW
jgi:hypothetical protein